MVVIHRCKNDLRSLTLAAGISSFAIFACYGFLGFVGKSVFSNGLLHNADGSDEEFVRAGGRSRSVGFEFFEEIQTPCGIDVVQADDDGDQVRKGSYVNLKLG
jgi:hypothetical protein